MSKMSRDRVEFILPSKYFQRRETSNGMNIDTCASVLAASFGCNISYWRKILYEAGMSSVRIRCRPSQFARFIIERCDQGSCVNGVRDLEAKRILPQPELNAYEKGEELFEVPAQKLQKISRMLGWTYSDFKNAVDEAIGYKMPDPMIYDVSKNPAVHDTCERKAL